MHGMKALESSGQAHSMSAVSTLVTSTPSPGAICYPQAHVSMCTVYLRGCMLTVSNKLTATLDGQAYKAVRCIHVDSTPVQMQL